MPLIDEYLELGGEGAVIMIADKGLGDVQANTSTGEWSQTGRQLTYRGHRVELHDEWSWGWMVRRADGSFVEAGDHLKDKSE